MRIHTLFDPLLTLVIWGTLLLGAISLSGVVQQYS